MEELEQERKSSLNTMDCKKKKEMKSMCVFAVTLRMLLIGMSVKVPAGAGAGAAGAAAGVGAAATACQQKWFNLHLERHSNKTLRHMQYDRKVLSSVDDLKAESF